MAKELWLATNLTIAGLIPWLVIRLLPGGNTLGLVPKALICLVFYGLFATRMTLEMGQTSLLVLLLMIGAVHTMNRNWLISGLLLGLALLKYQLAVPVLILVFLIGKFHIVALSLLVQAVGVWMISSLKGGSPYLTAHAYIEIMRAHIAQDGIELAARFAERSRLALLAVAAITAVSLVAVGYRVFLRIVRKPRDSTTSFEWLLVLNILGLWSMLFVYHGTWDGVLSILYFGLVIYAVNRPDLPGLSPLTRAALSVVLIGSGLLMSLPTVPEQVLARFSMQQPLFGYLSVMSLTLVGMLAVSLWLLYATSPRLAAPQAERLPAVPAATRANVAVPRLAALATPAVEYAPAKAVPAATQANVAVPSVVALVTPAVAYAPAEPATVAAVADEPRPARPTQSCPRCDLPELVRIHRRWYDRLRPRIVARMRCRACGREVLV